MCPLQPRNLPSKTCPFQSLLPQLCVKFFIFFAGEKKKKHHFDGGPIPTIPKDSTNFWDFLMLFVELMRVSLEGINPEVFDLRQLPFVNEKNRSLPGVNVATHNDESRKTPCVLQTPKNGTLKKCLGSPKAMGKKRGSPHKDQKWPDPHVTLFGFWSIFWWKVWRFGESQERKWQPMGVS